MLIPGEQVIIGLCLAYLGVLGLIAVGLGVRGMFDYSVEKLHQRGRE